MLLMGLYVRTFGALKEYDKSISLYTKMYKRRKLNTVIMRIPQNLITQTNDGTYVMNAVTGSVPKLY